MRTYTGASFGTESPWYRTPPARAPPASASRRGAVYEAMRTAHTALLLLILRAEHVAMRQVAADTDTDGAAATGRDGEYNTGNPAMRWLTQRASRPTVAPAMWVQVEVREGGVRQGCVAAGGAQQK